MTAHRIAGSVTRENVCHADGPERLGGLLLLRADLAQVGTTSRTTNGSVTKIVASTIDGVAKRIS